MGIRKNIFFFFFARTSKGSEREYIFNRLFLPLSNTHTISLSLSHTHTHKHTQAHAHAHTQAHAHAHAQAHIHKHTHTYNFLYKLHWQTINFSFKLIIKSKELFFFVSFLIKLPIFKTFTLYCGKTLLFVEIMSHI